VKIAEYISSGILESYLLGELSAQECAHVEALAQEHAEIKQELLAIGAQMDALYHASAIVPPADLQEEVIDALFNERTKQVPSAQEPTKAILRQLQFYQWVAAAAVALAIVASIVAIQFRSQYRQVQSELIGLLEENTRMAEQFEQTKSSREAYEEAYAVLHNPQFAKITLAGLALAPEAKAAVLWNKETKAVYMTVAELPENAEGLQYQLWALVDGQPVDAGVFDWTNDGQLIIRLKDIDKADAFAVTLEPKGGSVHPTLDKMYLYGS
jgi:anti-sigma-K factor RskA